MKINLTKINLKKKKTYIKKKTMIMKKKTKKTIIEDPIRGINAAATTEKD